MAAGSTDARHDCSPRGIPEVVCVRLITSGIWRLAAG
jgi:hypothetical protein